MSPSDKLPNLTGSFVDDGYLQLVQFLGCGTFAKVYKAIDTTFPAEDPAYFAVKCMKNDVAGSRRLAAMENEFQTHAAVDYQEGVVSFHRVFIEGEFVFVVLDLCESDMHSGVLDGRRYAANPAIAKAAFIELLDAVEECHQAGVYHRDLKPANILCDSVGTGIRLADFGVATWKEESCQFAIGSPGYMSPEGLDRTRGSYSSSQSDAWALAVIFVNITTGNIPWGMATLKDPRYAAFRADPENCLRKNHNLTHEANDILRWCFHVDPERRPTIAQLRAAVLATEDTLLVVHTEPSSAVVQPSALNGSTRTSSAVEATPSSSTTSSGAPSTPPALDAEPRVAIVDLLDEPNVGLASMLPLPLIPKKLYGPEIPPPRPSHLKSAPEFRFVDHKRQGVANRKRFADKLRRVY